jgi:uncharacterized membrane protein
LKWTGLLLGFALGGFFDGILLHQILQWHHLLSNVDAVKDMRAQILADGIFHALMYAIAAVALFKLWRRRSDFAAPGADLALFGHALVGFGAWHIADAVFSHWITGIHRIKLDSPNPLVWDLAWFFAFGVVPALLGCLVLRKAGQGGGGPGRGAAAALGVAALLAGPMAALPGGNSDQVIVVFAPGVSGAAAFKALAQVDARILWTDRSAGVWAVSMKDPRAAAQLYGKGAMMVSNSAIAFGCISWSRVRPTSSQRSPCSTSGPFVNAAEPSAASCRPWPSARGPAPLSAPFAATRRFAHGRPRRPA